MYREEEKKKILDFVNTYQPVKSSTIQNALKIPDSKGIIITLLADGKLDADWNWNLTIGDGRVVD